MKQVPSCENLLILELTEKRQTDEHKYNEDFFQGRERDKGIEVSQTLLPLLRFLYLKRRWNLRKTADCSRCPRLHKPGRIYIPKKVERKLLSFATHLLSSIPKLSESPPGEFLPNIPLSNVSKFICLRANLRQVIENDLPNLLPLSLPGRMRLPKFICNLRSGFSTDYSDSLNSTESQF